MHIDLSGRVVVITGAGRGIGATLASRFAAEGARLVLIEKDRANLDRVASSLGSVNVLPIHGDVTDEHQVNDAMTSAISRFGRVDVLINNAGIAPTADIETMTAQEWQDTFSANTTGVFFCSRAVIPHMKAAERGRILSASSFAAVIPSLGFGAYAASKAAVVAFTRVLAAELGPWGITANTYTPGMIPTPLNSYAEAPAATQERLLNTLSLRKWGSAEDIASLLIFLASDYASYITGADLEITGGKYAVQFPQLAYERKK
ncbi:MAG: SDR family oxidoreductase [Cyanobacteria bacterium]|nr:SDR family oxidoreductase [Cyanobacteriota bacterium]